MEALISVILPVYNGEKYLRESIESVMGQTYKNWELLIIDDCSTDSSPEIAKKYVSRDERIHYYRNSQNLGLPRTLNKGFSLANGDYLTWTSDDNRYKIDAFNRLYTALSCNKNAQFAFASCRIIDGEGKEIEYIMINESQKKRIVGNNIVGACFMYTRKVYEEVGDYNPEYTLVEDYDYWQRIFIKYETIAISDILYEYRWHDGALTSTMRKTQFNETLEKMLLKNQSGFGNMDWEEKYFFYKGLQSCRENIGAKQNPYKMKYKWYCFIYLILYRIPNKIKNIFLLKKKEVKRMIKLYYHGGSANHGCEAIVRSTAKIVGEHLELNTLCLKEDMKYELEQIVSVVEDSYIPVKKRTLKYFLCALDHKLFKHDYLFVKLSHKKFLSRASKKDVYMSIGGDNYCYAGVDKLGYYNRMLHKKGAKTVLWGCSIEPSVLTNSVINDLKRYDLITVRESLSYEGLKQAGISENVVLCSDPAFQLDMELTELPNGFNAKNTVGINASPLVMKDNRLVLENYVELIKSILEKTKWNVLLIPHVVKKETDDRESLLTLREYFKDEPRIQMVDDYNCMQLKSIISQCRMFVGARTHATIAAYSTCVPTLTVGYSIKSRGIAKDIFGQEENYVVPIEAIDDKKSLENAFFWMVENENSIKTFLKERIPEYCKKSLDAKEALRRLVENEQ